MDRLTGEPGSVLLVRPVPPLRTSLAEFLFAAHPVPVGSSQGPDFGGVGVVMWELCDPAAGDEPPQAVVATGPRESGGVAEVLGAAVIPGGSAAALLRRLFTDVAAVLRPAGYPMLIACVPVAQPGALDLLGAAGFAAEPRFAGRLSGPGPQPPEAAGGGQPGHEPSADSYQAGRPEVIWFTLEL